MANQEVGQPSDMAVGLRENLGGQVHLKEGGVMPPEEQMESITLQSKPEGGHPDKGRLTSATTFT